MSTRLQSQGDDSTLLMLNLQSSLNKPCCISHLMDDAIDHSSSNVRFACIKQGARFVGGSLAASTLNGLILGVVAGEIGKMATPIGPDLPSLCGFLLGFVLGLIGHWRARRADCLHYATYYPTILSHALWVTGKVDVPQDVIYNDEMKEWILQDWARFSWAILAAQSCRTDVEVAIERNKRRRLVEESSEADESRGEH